MSAKPKASKATAQRKILKRGKDAGAGTAGDPATPVDNLFAAKFAAQRPIYDAVAGYLRKLGAVVSPRRGHVALYRLRQFGAIKPSRDGLLVGLALQKYPKAAKFKDVKKLGAGDRNKKALILPSLKDFDAEAKALISSAWAEN